MKKRKAGRKLSRERGQRKALIKSLAYSFFLHERIKTTEAKAKELRPFVEKCITKAKKGDLSCRRYLIRFFDEKIVKKMIEQFGARYKNRKGGYTRILKLGCRKSDGSKTAIIELVE